MVPRVIALYSSVMQSGKSTTAQYLSEAYGYKLIRFCDPLKDMVDTMLGYAGLSDDDIWEHLYGSKKEWPIKQLNGVTARHLMQTLGTEWGRQHVFPDLWVNLALKRVKDAPLIRFVIDDMRFANEYAAVRSIYGAQVWRVNRPGAHATNGHVSEGQLDSHLFDKTLDNSGSIQDLHSQINKVIAG